MSSQQVAQDSMIDITLKFPAMDYTYFTKWWASRTISDEEYVLKNIFKVGLADVILTYNGEELFNNIPLRNINPALTPMDILIEFDIDDSDEVEVFVPAPPKPKSQPKPRPAQRLPPPKGKRFKAQLHEDIEFDKECFRLLEKFNALPESMKPTKRQQIRKLFKL